MLPFAGHLFAKCPKGNPIYLLDCLSTLSDSINIQYLGRIVRTWSSRREWSWMIEGYIAFTVIRSGIENQPVFGRLQIAGVIGRCINFCIPWGKNSG